MEYDGGWNGDEEEERDEQHEHGRARKRAREDVVMMTSSPSSSSDQRQQDKKKMVVLLLHRIKGLVRGLVQDMSSSSSNQSSGGGFQLLLPRYRNYCSLLNSNPSSSSCSCSYDFPIGNEILSIHKEPHACRLNILLTVLVIIQQLLQQNKHCSKRDIYYMHPSIFGEQAAVDHAINDICVLFKCSRHNLNVVPVGKGLVMGWLRFMEAGRKVNCIETRNTAFPIPVSIEEVEDVVTVADYILVVEKETVFQRLANDKFCQRNRCIVITGRGYPDVPTRRFLRHLVEHLHLPVYCLVDSDPYGFDILATYRFGSMQMAYDAKLLRVPKLRWLGVFTSDYEEYHLPDCCLLNLSSDDRRKAEAMLTRCYLHREAPEWRLELERMLQKGVKFEIEALSANSIAFLSEVYIPRKIQQGRHI